MLNPLEMERYIAATARRADLAVKWNEDGQCSTDGKTINLPQMTSSTSYKEYQHLRHAVCHEVDHVLYSDFDDLDKRGLDPRKSLLGAIWNCTEDHRIEYLGDMEYEGDRLCNNDVNADLIEKRIKEIKKGTIPTEVATNFMPLIAWSHGVAADYHPSLHRLKDSMAEAVPAEGKAYLDKLMKGDYAEVLRNIRTIADRKEGTAATLALSERIFKEVFEKDPEKEKQRCKEEKEKEEREGKGKDGKGGKDGQGKGQGKAVGGKGDEGKDGKPTDVNTKELLSYDYTGMVENGHIGMGRHDIHMDYSKHKPRYDYVPARAGDYNPVDHRKRGTGGDRRGFTGEINSALRHTSAGFAHKVRTILQVRDRDRYQYGLKKGNLHNSALHRVVVKDAPGYNERVFKRRITTDVLDAAITLLVDQSGSMSGQKYAHAAAAAVMLNDVVGNVLHIPTEIVGFTDQGSSPTGNGSLRYMHVHRSFSDKRVPNDGLIKTFSNAADMGMSGNADGDAIMWVFDRLICRQEKRKLLVVFSDGQPSGGGSGDIDTYTCKVVKEIEKDTPVDIVGIGIMDRNVERIYKEHYTINKADQLETALLALIENKLK